MSGGVDSSVTAALLLQQGFGVEGVTMKLTAGLCCDIGSAQAVCGHLGIPHRMIDAQERSPDDCPGFYFRIPQRPHAQPLHRCNDLIKFQLLLDYARERLRCSRHRPLCPHRTGQRDIALSPQKRRRPRQGPELLPLPPDAGADPERALSRSADMRKTEVRGLARELESSGCRTAREPGDLLCARMTIIAHS